MEARSWPEEINHPNDQSHGLDIQNPPFISPLLCRRPLFFSPVPGQNSALLPRGSVPDSREESAT